MGRRTSARGGGGSTAWPGASSQLTSGSGSAVTVGSGLSLSAGTLTASGGWSPAARYSSSGASRLWLMDEASGTSLVDTITGTNALTLSANHILAQTTIYKGYNCIGTIGAPTGTTYVSGSSVMSLASTDALTFVVHAMVTQLPSALTAVFDAENVSNKDLCVVQLQSTGLNLYTKGNSSAGNNSPIVSIPLGVPIQIAVTWPVSGTATLYLNGAAAVATSTGGARTSGDPMTEMYTCLSRVPGFYIASLRVDKSVLSAATLQAMYNTLLRM